MIASLPMYDRAETAAANDRLWGFIRNAYGGDLPTQLSRGRDPWDDWTDPELVLSQTCGMPYRTTLRDKVALIGTPIHALECAPGYYYSVLISRSGDHRSFAEFRDAVLACNDPVSQSGWAAPWALARSAGFSFSRPQSRRSSSGTRCSPGSSVTLWSSSITRSNESEARQWKRRRRAASPPRRNRRRIC